MLELQFLYQLAASCSPVHLWAFPRQTVEACLASPVQMRLNLRRKLSRRRLLVHILGWRTDKDIKSNKYKKKSLFFSTFFLQGNNFYLYSKDIGSRSEYPFCSAYAAKKMPISYLGALVQSQVVWWHHALRLKIKKKKLYGYESKLGPVV